MAAAPQPKPESVSGARTVSTPKSRGENRAQRATARPTPQTRANVSETPTVAATLPSAGPRSAPTTAALPSVPSICPLRSSGVCAVSQVSAETHESALPNPAASRSATSSHAPLANPKSRLATDIRQSPATAVGLTPSRVARYPPGADPRSTPAPNAPLKTPTNDFESLSSSVKYGTSGVRAA